MASDDSWRTPTFRQSVVSKIEEAIKQSGMPTSKNSGEMENHVFQKAKTKEEYLSFVARLILHVREMNSKKPGGIGPGGNQGGPGMPDPINALQNLASQGTRTNQMMGLGGPQAPGMGGPPGPGMTGPQGPAANLLQSLNRPGLGLQGLPNKMPGMPMVPNTGQMTNQLGNQMQPQMPGQLPNQLGNQMPGQNMNQMQGQLSNQLQNTLSGQLQTQGQMPNQMPGQMTGQMPGQMGGQMPGLPINQMPGHMPNQMMNMQQMQRNPTGFTGQRNVAPNQYMQQSPTSTAHSPAGLGGTQPGNQMVASPALVPSPSSAMTMMSQRPVGMAPSPSSSLNTPGQAVPTPSPIGMQEDQAYRDKVRQLSKYIEPLRKMIARMGTDADCGSAPLDPALDAGSSKAKKVLDPVGLLDPALQSLVTKTVPGNYSHLKRFLAYPVLTHSDVEKLSKMKKLLEILSNPSKRMPLDTLLKCEVVLEKLDLKRSEGSVPQNASTQFTLKEHHISNPLLEAVSNCLQSPVINHTLQRTFGPSTDALKGPEIKGLPPPLKKKKVEEPASDIPDVLQGEIARLDSRFKVSLDPSQQPGSHTIQLICWLDDRNLPCVPPVSLTVPEDYPKNPPSCHMAPHEYNSTQFLSTVQKVLQMRVEKLPKRYSVSQLLDTWEMSVRQACAPKQTPVSVATLLMGLN